MTHKKRHLRFFLPIEDFSRHLLLIRLEKRFQNFCGRADTGVVMLDRDATNHGGVETAEEAKKYANLLREHESIHDPSISVDIELACVGV